MYWIAIYELLEQAGITCYLVNAQPVKHFCAWLGLVQAIANPFRLVMLHPEGSRQ